VTDPFSTGEMRAVGMNVELRDAIARWAADPDNPIDVETWRDFPPAYRALLRRQAEKLFLMPEIREVLARAEQMGHVQDVVDSLAALRVSQPG